MGCLEAECFRLRHVRVEALLQARDARGVKWRAFTSAHISRPGPEDGTLGLLLHGTSVVGFCSEEAALARLVQSQAPPSSVTCVVNYIPFSLSNFSKLVFGASRTKPVAVFCEVCR